MVDSAVAASMVSDRDLIPDEVENELIFWRDVYRAGAFAIGDITARIIERAAQLEFRVTDERVFAAVGKLCDRRPRTVRYYYECASFYPVSVREEYAILPFSHFVFARHMGDRWKEVLDFSLDHPLASVGYLELHFLDNHSVSVSVSADTDADVSASVFAGTPVSADGGVRVFAGDGAAVQGVGHGAARARLLSALSAAVASLERLITTFDLAPETASDLRAALKTIRRWMPELLAADNKVVV